LELGVSFRWQLGQQPHSPGRHLCHGPSIATPHTSTPGPGRLIRRAAEGIPDVVLALGLDPAVLRERIAQSRGNIGYVKCLYPVAYRRLEELLPV
jgi:hypothetical protein